MTEILNIEIYNFLFIFLRIGSCIAFMPGFMTNFLYARARLCIALSISVVLIPFLSPELPPVPSDFLEMLKICLFEITYGAFLGLIMQILFSCLALAGNFAGQAIGFANAQMFDPNTLNQSMVVEVFLTLLAVTIIFLTDIHHLMLGAIIDSYALFKVGSPLPVSDFAEFMTDTVNKSFVMGFKIASPFIAFSIVFYCGLGLFSRLMPQLNVFFLSLPLQIYLGLGLLLITTPIMILWFTKYYEDGLEQFIK